MFNIRKAMLHVLFLATVAMTSCTHDDAWDEEVTMHFCPVIDDALSRSEASASSMVNAVVCAVFEKGNELTPLREVIDLPYINPSITYSPRLVKGHTYDVVFWAFHKGYYDVDDLKNITPIQPDSAYGTHYDAFTGSIVARASEPSDLRQTVSLTRPFACLNFSVPATNWDTIALKPTKMQVRVASVKDSYDALAGQSIGNATGAGRTLMITADAQADGTRRLASCYILAADEGQKADVTYSVYIEDSMTLTRSIPNVQLRTNCITNISGGLLGTTK